MDKPITQDARSKKRSKGLLTTFLVIASLGVYGLVVNVNPGQMQNSLMSFEIKEESVSVSAEDAAAAAAADKMITDKPSHDLELEGFTTGKDGAAEAGGQDKGNVDENVGREDEKVLVKEEASVTSAPSCSPTSYPSYNQSVDLDFAFHGAKEWHENWVFASLKGKDTIHQTHKHDDYVASELHVRSAATLNHQSKMKKRYINLNAVPDLRGLGWIENRLNMILTVIVAGDRTDSLQGGNVTLAAGQVSIFIVDVVGAVRCGNGAADSSDASWMNYQPPLTLWVRANGPEIHAGTALPHLLLPVSESDRGRCAWRYDFDATLAGSYDVDVKVLTFNGFASFDNEKCRVENMPTKGKLYDSQTASEQAEIDMLDAINREAVREFASNRSYTHHRGVLGFKLYDPIDACCEACSRARGCKMWSHPGALKLDDCELYFNSVEEDLDYYDTGKGYLGRDLNYSYLAQRLTDYPSNRHLRHHHVQRKLSIRSEFVNDTVSHKSFPQMIPPQFGYGRNESTAYFLGCGWNSMLTWESPCHYPTDDMVFGSGLSVRIKPNVQQIDPPTRQCTLNDEHLNLSKGRWVRMPFDDKTCPPLRNDENNVGFRNFIAEYHSEMPISCWHREDISKLGLACGEKHCSETANHRYISSLHNETRWMGQWQSAECIYNDLNNDDVQACVQARNISSIDVAGRSISAILKVYLTQRLQNITLAADGPGSKKVVLDTFSMPHILWHQSTKAYLDTLDAMPVVSEDREHYFITGFFYTSEREPHVQVDRSLLYSQIASKTLGSKGYKMINAFDVTAAFSYDTAGQFDGLHIIGPPIRALLTKFFHHLCR